MRVVYHVDTRFIGSHPLLLILGKRCTSCFQFKDFDHFGDDRVQRDGMKTMCRACRHDPRVKSYRVPADSPDMKVCTKCLQPKNREQDFDKTTDSPDGYSWYCKQCRSEYNHDFRQENHERFLEYDHVRNRTSERKAQKRRIYHEKWANNPRYIAMAARHSRDYAQRHPERRREHLYRRKARMLNASIDPVDYKAILERDGWHCYICDKPIDPALKWPHRACLTFDHIVPLFPRSGEPQGTHSEENIKCTHHACNVRKSNKPLEILTPFERRGVD